MQPQEQQYQQQQFAGYQQGNSQQQQFAQQQQYAQQQQGQYAQQGQSQQQYAQQPVAQQQGQQQFTQQAQQGQQQQYAQQQQYTQQQFAQQQGQQQQGQQQYGQQQGQQQQYAQQGQQGQQQGQQFSTQQSQQGQQQHGAQQQQQLQQQQQPTIVTPPVPTSPFSTRWSWHSYPANRLDGTRMVVPLGCLYSPLGLPAPELHQEPIRCVCGGVLNPHSTVDHRSHTWGCVLCGNKNAFPTNVSLAPEHMPSELSKNNESIEYVTNMKRAPPTFVFVLDTCVDTESELEGLKEYVLLALNKLPENCRVGLITYGATVQLHELSGATEFPRSMVFRGSAETTAEQIKAIVKNPAKYLGNFADAEFLVSSIIDDLQGDLWPVPKDHRPLRATGAALSVAASLLEVVSPAVGSCVYAFISGVATEGPGLVVTTPKEIFIRGHADLRDNTATAKHWSAANNFYDTLMRRMVKQGHSLSVFSACLDQTGVAEMKVCIQAAGGMIMVSDSWKQQPFRTSLNKFLRRKEDGNLELGLNVTMDISTSSAWKVMGVIGACVGTGRKSNSVADTEIGMGGTCQWTTCMLDPSTTTAVYFETTLLPTDASARREQYRYVQFVTKYEVGSQVRLRVTTLKHHIQEKTNFPDLAHAFDQETAAVLLARQAIHKTDTTPVFDVLRWLDRTVVRLVNRFGTFEKDQPSTLKLPRSFVHFPTFIYHLRRSAYLQVFNSSPDETAMLRLLFVKAPCPDSVLMIQPTLYSYTMQGAPEPVPLDSSAIRADNILVLDTFFEVLIHHGETIAAWKKQGFDEKEEYAYFKQFLEMPRGDAAVLVDSRYPTPRFFEVAKGEPNARILYNKVNPSRTHNTAADASANYGSAPGELVYTDDAPLQVFMDHLKKLAVQQS